MLKSLGFLPNESKSKASLSVSNILIQCPILSFSSFPLFDDDDDVECTINVFGSLKVDGDGNLDSFLLRITFKNVVLSAR